MVLDAAGEVDAGGTAAERNALRKTRLAAPELDGATAAGLACAACRDSGRDRKAPNLSSSSVLRSQQ